ncbi:MAG: AbrB/MazE/SpoVT family DNA-binding domain-containing protein [Candidatus Micrarchaeota archaeon]|nr:AbrB/MazE/SpoVT family DNA-binding domain-containing protein [Candidatus Micrarchaeota archaeon]
MAVVRVDQKMRIRLPKRISGKLRLKAKEALNIEEKNGEIRISKLKDNLSESLVLRDMIERPMHTKMKITSELLDKWEEEMWSS